LRVVCGLLTRVSMPCSSSIASRNLWETRLSCSPSSERSVELFRSRFGALSRVFWWVPCAKSGRWVCLCVFLELRFLLQILLLDFLRRFTYVFLFSGEELWSEFFLGVYAYGTKEFSTDVLFFCVQETKYCQRCCCCCCFLLQGTFYAVHILCFVCLLLWLVFVVPCNLVCSYVAFVAVAIRTVACLFPSAFRNIIRFGVFPFWKLCLTVDQNFLQIFPWL
jgi:hypothetical protein